MNLVTFTAYIYHRFKLLNFEMYFAKSFAFLPTFLVGILPFLGFAQHLMMRHREFYKMANTSLVGNVTATRKVKDYFDCSFLCLEYGPFACLSFNIAGNSDNGYHVCELSNSERYLEPQKMQERLHYDYYGTATEVCSKCLCL